MNVLVVSSRDSLRHLMTRLAYLRYLRTSFGRSTSKYLRALKSLWGSMEHHPCHPLVIAQTTPKSEFHACYVEVIGGSYGIFNTGVARYSRVSR